MRNDNRKRPARKATTAAASQKKGQRGSHGGRSPAGRTDADPVVEMLEAAIHEEIRSAMTKALNMEARRLRRGFRLADMAPQAFIFYDDDPPEQEHANCRSAFERDPEADMIDVAFLPEKPLLPAPGGKNAKSSDLSG